MTKGKCITEIDEFIKCIDFLIKEAETLSNDESRSVDERTEWRWTEEALVDVKQNLEIGKLRIN